MSSQKLVTRKSSQFLLRLGALTMYFISRAAVEPLIRGKDGVMCDIGCGMGSPFQRQIRLSMHSVGIDVFHPFLVAVKKKGLYDELVCASAANLPIRSSSFDFVCSFQVLEHLTKSEGRDLLTQVQKIAGRRIIISTPVGWTPQNDKANPYNVHKSAWQPCEFRDYGYRCKGYLFRNFYDVFDSDNRERNYLIWFLRGFLRIIFSWLLFPILIFTPYVCTQMVCFKDVEPKRS